jgi:phage gp29-like protein/2'-5' RNA ligase
MPLFSETPFVMNGQPHKPPALLGPDGLPFKKDTPSAGLPLAQVLPYSSLLSSGFRSYWHGKYDEAYRRSREDALAMRQDTFLMSRFQERKLSCASLGWHIEVDNERDPFQRAVQGILTRILKHIPRFGRMRYYLLEAVWYGRYASMLDWKWDIFNVPSLKNYMVDEPRRCLLPRNHSPINGDKIGHHWDGTPYILLNPSYASYVPNSILHPTTAGATGLYLYGSWRWKFIIHTHEALDEDYWEPERAEAVFGIGIRSVLYWYWWMRNEWTAAISDWIERTGLGVRIWYYQANNPQSLAAVQQAALNQSDKVNLLVPRYLNNSAESVEFVETASSGADLMLKLVETFKKEEERYIIGQAMSGGRDDEGSLGGSGRAKLAEATKAQITKYDAQNLGETITTDLLLPIKHWSIPEARDIDARFVFNVDDPDPKETMEAAKGMVSFGLPIRADSIYSATQFEKPQPGDDVVSIKSIAEQQQAVQPMQPVMTPAMVAPSEDDDEETPVPVQRPADKTPEKEPAKKADDNSVGSFFDESHPAKHFAKRGHLDRWEKGANKHAYASTQLNFGPEAATAIRWLAAKIPDDALAEDGREDKPHCTILYGLHEDVPEPVMEVVRGFGPITLRLGKTECFETPEYDVVYIAVESLMLKELNAAMRATLPHTMTHPEYVPHVCLAYVKSGMGKQFVGNAALDGVEETFWTVFFSDKERNQTAIALAQDTTMARYAKVDATEEKPVSSAMKRLEALIAAPPVLTIDRKFLASMIEDKTVEEIADHVAQFGISEFFANYDKIANRGYGLAEMASDEAGNVGGKHFETYWAESLASMYPCDKMTAEILAAAEAMYNERQLERHVKKELKWMSVPAEFLMTLGKKTSPECE